MDLWTTHPHVDFLAFICYLLPVKAFYINVTENEQLVTHLMRHSNNFRMLNIILFNFMFHKSFSIAGSITFNLHINQSRWFSLFAQESCKLKFWTCDTYCVNPWYRRVLLQNTKWSWKRCALHSQTEYYLRIERDSKMLYSDEH